MQKQNLNEKKLKEELTKRRLAMGVQTQVKGVKQELKAVIYNQDSQLVEKTKNPFPP